MSKQHKVPKYMREEQQQEDQKKKAQQPQGKVVKGDFGPKSQKKQDKGKSGRKAA